MAKVIQSFLVGIGLDTTQLSGGVREFNRSMGAVANASGIAGSAIVGAFGLAATSAINAGKRVDDLVLSTEKFNTSTQFVYTYGNALKTLGGDANEAAQAIATAESALDEFRLKGSFSAFEDSVFAGVDTFRLTQAQSGEEFLRALSEMTPQMTPDQLRLLQSSFGFSDAVMRSLRQGQDEFNRLIAESAELGGSISGAASAAREFNEEMAKLGIQFQAIGNTLAERMLPSFSQMLRDIGSFVSENKGAIDSAIDRAEKNPEAMAAITAGGTAAVAGTAAKAVGMRTIGAGLTRLGGYGILAGGTLIAADAAKDQPWDDWWGSTANEFGRLRDKISNIGAPDVEQYGPEVPVVESSMQGGVTTDLGLGDIERHQAADTGFLFDGGYLDPRFVGSVTPDESALHSPVVTNVQSMQDHAGAVASDLRQAPIRVENNIELGVRLSGRQFEAEVTDIVERREQMEYESIRGTTRY